MDSKYLDRNQEDGATCGQLKLPPFKENPISSKRYELQRDEIQTAEIGGVQTMRPKALDDNDFPETIHTIRRAIYRFLQVRLCSTTESFLAESFSQNSLILGLYTFEVEASVPISAPQSFKMQTNNLTLAASQCPAISFEINRK